MQAQAQLALGAAHARAQIIPSLAACGLKIHTFEFVPHGAACYLPNHTFGQLAQR